MRSIKIGPQGLLVLIVGALLLGVQLAHADDYVLTLKDHLFTPPNLVIPANQKIKLTVKNDSDATAEFESSDLEREKVITAHNQITIFIGPVSAGSYTYFDDFHRETTGIIIAK
jgi:hypothetical protein